MKHQDLGQNILMVASCLQIAEKNASPPILNKWRIRSTGRLSGLLQLLKPCIEVIEVTATKGLHRGRCQRKFRVLNLRLKVLMVVGFLVPLVTQHVQEEVAVSAHSNLYYLPPNSHSLMTSCPHLCLRGCANLQALEPYVHTVLWMVLSKCLDQNCVLVIGHWDHRSGA